MDDRGLNAVPVEKLAFDLRCLDGLIADQLYLEPILVSRADVLARTDELAGTEQELPFQRLHGGRVIA